jgi:PadR family transcriptional regulator
MLCHEKTGIPPRSYRWTTRDTDRKSAAAHVVSSRAAGVPDASDKFVKGNHLGELEHVTLLAIARLGRNADASAIHREIAASTGRAITPATVYVTLGRLEKKRYAKSRAALTDVGRGRRPRKLYRVTLEGIMELQSIRVAHARLWRDLPFDPLSGDTMDTGK